MALHLLSEELHTAAHAGPRQGRNQPRLLHGLVFFLALPIMFALWAAAIGMPPTPVIGLWGGILYISTQVVAAWWMNALVARLLTSLLSQYRLRLWVLLLLGFWLAWTPLTVFYFGHANFFATLYPALTADAAIRSFSWQYGWELLRYSIPFLPLWIGAVYGYRYATGVDWFGAQRAGLHVVPTSDTDVLGRSQVADGARLTARQGSEGKTQVPEFIKRSHLPPHAIPVAIKADEHYVHVWTADSSDIVRYRFQDALTELEEEPGGQVHRSWWVRWDAVSTYSRRGQTLTLRLANDLDVPVSLAHKAAVLAAIN